MWILIAIMTGITGLGFVYIGMSLVRKIKVLSYIFNFAGVCVFMAGLLNFARMELGFTDGRAALVLLIGISAVAARYLVVSAEELSCGGNGKIELD